jgi:hypothetical protein
MRKSKTIETYVVRNRAGQYLGNFRAISAEAAIEALIRADAVQASQFRSYTPLKREELKAEVEQ